MITAILLFFLIIIVSAVLVFAGIVFIEVCSATKMVNRETSIENISFDKVILPYN